MLRKQFLEWHTDGCSTAPVTDFINNPVAQGLLNETKYFGDDSDEILYVDLRQSDCYTDELEKPTKNDSKMTITIETKNVLRKKMRLGSLELYKRRIHLSFTRRLINLKIQNIYFKIAV